MAKLAYDYKLELQQVGCWGICSKMAKNRNRVKNSTIYILEIATRGLGVKVDKMGSKIQKVSKDY